MMTPGLQSVSLVADAGWAGRLGVAVFDRAGGVGPLRPAQRSPAQDDRLRPASGLPAPLAAGPGPGGGGRWRLPKPSSCGIARTSKPIVVVPNCARTSLYSPRSRPRPDRRPRVARDCPVRLRCWTIPLHNGFPTAPPVPTAVPRGRARFGRSAVVPRRAAAPSHTWVVIRYLAAPRALCFAMHRHRRNPCGYCTVSAAGRSGEGAAGSPAWKPSASGRNEPSPVPPRSLACSATLAADILMAWHGARNDTALPSPTPSPWSDDTSGCSRELLRRPSGTNR